LGYFGAFGCKRPAGGAVGGAGYKRAIIGRIFAFLLLKCADNQVIGTSYSLLPKYAIFFCYLLDIFLCFVYNYFVTRDNCFRVLKAARDKSAFMGGLMYLSTWKIAVRAHQGGIRLFLYLGEFSRKEFL